MRSVKGWWVLAMLWAAAGCGRATPAPGGTGGASSSGAGGTGGAGNAGSCGSSACGGDVVGTWTVSSACVDAATLTKLVLGPIASCPGASLSHITTAPSGELTLNYDTSYTMSLTVNLSFTIEFPSNCFDAGGCQGGDPTFLKGLAGGATFPVNGSVTCGGTTACSCNQDAPLHFTDQDGGVDTGLYTVVTMVPMPVVAFEPSTFIGNSGPYCVQGNTLSLGLTALWGDLSVIPVNMVFSKS